MCLKFSLAQLRFARSISVLFLHEVCISLRTIIGDMLTSIFDALRTKGALVLENFYSSLVDEDSPEAWAKLREQMPWNWATSEEDKKLIEQLGLEEVEIDTSDRQEINNLLKNSEEGTIFGEYFFEPFISINDDFYSYVLSSQQIFLLEKDSTPSIDELVCLYRAKTSIVTNDFSPISFLAVVCPRCQLRFTEGDEDLDFQPEDCVFEDCIACDGTGEWLFELAL